MKRRLRSLFRRDDVESDLSEEIALHLDMETEDLVRQGRSREAARREARIRLGGIDKTKEDCRDARGIRLLENLLRDARYGIRGLAHTPGFTAVLSLAVGIGANTAIFSVVNGVLLKPLPFPNADRLLSVSHSAAGVNVDDLASAPFLYFTEREQNRVFEDVALWSVSSAGVTGNGEPEQVTRLLATAGFLKVLRVKPAIGRSFSEKEDTPAGRPTVILMHGYWQRRFGGDPAVIGKRIIVNEESSEIIGVMPAGFRFLNFSRLDMILPYRIDRGRVAAGGYGVRGIARLKPGITVEQAMSDVRRLIGIAKSSWPLPPGISRQQLERLRLGPRLAPLKQSVVGDVGKTLWILMGTIGMVLLIACANVANLLMVRTTGRQQELTVRAALGASWPRIAGELLTESAVLALAGALVGLGVAYGSLRLVLALGANNLPRLEEIAIDRSVLVFTAGVSILAGLLFGLMPVARYARPRLAEALRLGGRSVSANRERLHVRNVLVVVQVALALVLLIGAGLMIRTFQELNSVSTGFTGRDELQAVRVYISNRVAPDPDAAVRREQEVRDKIAALPGVTAAAFASYIPLQGDVITQHGLTPEGLREGDRPRVRDYKLISPEYIATMGIRLAAGRNIDWTDVYQKRPVVMISENLARLEWGGASRALGKRLRTGAAVDQWREIVGIVADVHDTGVREPANTMIYYPALVERIFSQPLWATRSVGFVIRSSRTGTDGFIADVRKAVSSVNPVIPLTNVRTVRDGFEASMSRTSFSLVMLGIAAGMALLLGVIGIYGIISYAVSQRTREVGIRIALGAKASEVRALFVRQGLVLACAGLVAGLAVAGALTRWMSSLLYEVSPLDLPTWVGVSVVLILAAAAASYVPSRRATGVDPVDALRAE
ncbi:MAG TPA: ABC transporter permease [Bryobacteraceae bacterium]|nr:ABC transporter permease [Bryobacteraceae bacterium]